MICFFDTALIKKYINELGAELVRIRLQSTSVVVSSVAKRTLDAIQLASALSVLDINYLFVSDIKLKVSGKAEGLSVIDPNETQP